MGRRVLIIGGGVIGLCSAYACARLGHQVHVVDAGSEDHAGCSYGNAGMIVPSHFTPLAAPGMVAIGLKWMWNPESPFYIKPRLDAGLLRWAAGFWRSATVAHVQRAAPLLRDLHLRSRAWFETFHDSDQLDFGLQRHGLLMLCQGQHALDEEAAGAEKARALGIPAEVLDSKETARHDPAITMNVAGSVYYPKDCHLAPDRFMSALRKTLAGLGVQFSWNTPIRTWRCDHARVIAAAGTSENFHADRFILAGGSWSPSLAGEAGLRLTMQAGKGYSLTLPHPPQLPRLCSILTEARVAVTPMGQTLRVGGTMEISGLDESIDPRRVRGMIRAMSAYYPEFRPEHFEGIQPWAGLRPCSPDGLPYLGVARRYPNLIVATGHAMMGLSLGPVTGEIAADLASDRKPGFDLSLLSPDRTC